MVTLTRVSVQPSPPKQITVKCPLCDLRFHLNYTEDEWNRVNTMLKSAKKALHADHKSGHQVDEVKMEWNPLRPERRH